MSKNLLYVLAGLFLLFVTLWWTRYQVVEIPGSNLAGFYRINRFTGKVQLVYVGKGAIRIITENKEVKIKSVDSPQSRPDIFDQIKQEREQTKPPNPDNIIWDDEK